MSKTEKTLVQQLERLFYDTKSTTIQELRVYYNHPDRQACKDAKLCERIFTVDYLYRYVQIAVDNMYAKLVHFTLNIVCLNYLRGLPEPNVMTVEESLEAFYQWCDFNKWDPQKFIKDLVVVLNKTYNKKNTFYLYGESNSGKTFMLLEPMRQLFKFVGRTAQLNSTSMFVFEGLLRQRLICLEEAQCDPMHLETMKLIMAGEECLINVKGGQSVVLKRTPVLIATNNQVWRYKIDEELAFRNRCQYYECSSWNVLDNDYIKQHSFNPEAYILLFNKYK